MVLHICSDKDGRCQVGAVDGVAADDAQGHAAQVVRDWTGSSLGDRVRYMAEREGVSLNKLGERAGLGSGAMSRLSRDRGPLNRSPETLDRLARAWGVSVEWLTYGRGQPEQVTLSSDRYPHRAEAARIALDGGVEPQAVREVLQEQLELDRDPSILWWLHRIEGKALRLREPANAQKPTSNDARATRSKK